MFQTLSFLRTMARAKLQEVRGDERGADAFEYLLVIGVVVVAVVAAVASGFPGGLINSVIQSVIDAVTDLIDNPPGSGGGGTD